VPTDEGVWKIAAREFGSIHDGFRLWSNWTECWLGTSYNPVQGMDESLVQLEYEAQCFDLANEASSTLFFIDSMSYEYPLF